MEEGMHVVADDRALLAIPPALEREEGVFYQSLTFRRGSFDASIFDHQGNCRGYVHVMYGARGEPLAVSRIDDVPGHVEAILAYSWEDIRAVGDPRVVAALPALERLLFARDLGKLVRDCGSSVH